MRKILIGGIGVVSFILTFTTPVFAHEIVGNGTGGRIIDVGATGFLPMPIMVCEPLPNPDLAGVLCSVPDTRPKMCYPLLTPGGDFRIPPDIQPVYGSRKARISKQCVVTMYPAPERVGY